MEKIDNTYWGLSNKQIDFIQEQGISMNDLDVLIDTDLTGFKQTDTKLNLKCSIFRNLFNVTPEFTDVN